MGQYEVRLSMSSGFGKWTITDDTLVYIDLQSDY